MNVTEVDLNIDEWLGAPGADTIIIPEGQPEKVEKPTVFSNPKVDFSFLDENTEVITDPTDPAYVAPKVDLNEIIEELTDGNVEDPAKKSPGRPKVEKSGLVEFFKKRIETKEMFAYDDYDESKQTLDEYLGSLSEKDMEELWTANVNNIKEEVAAVTPKAFFESLPEELRYAAKYVEDGGTDLKGLFQALSHVEQVRSLDPEVDEDQEQIVRSYLTATAFGNEEEISEQIAEWKDLNSLGKKASGFKPKLDKMQNQIVTDTVARQESAKLAQQKAAKEYTENVFEALRPGEINGLKLDKTTQAKLYTGLTQPSYTSISGRPTNLLGHLLEEHQFVKPNYELISEVLWLLSDPEEYRKSLTKSGKNAATEEITRKLKTEQSKKTTTTSQFDDQNDPNKTRKIPRNTTGFFAR